MTQRLRVGAMPDETDLLFTSAQFDAALEEVSALEEAQRRAEAARSDGPKTSGGSPSTADSSDIQQGQPPPDSEDDEADDATTDEAAAAAQFAASVGTGDAPDGADAQQDAAPAGHNELVDADELSAALAEAEAEGDRIPSLDVQPPDKPPAAPPEPTSGAKKGGKRPLFASDEGKSAEATKAATADDDAPPKPDWWSEFWKWMRRHTPWGRQGLSPHVWLYKKAYRTLDKVLELINLPAGSLSSEARNVVGALGLVTLAVALAAWVIVPKIIYAEDPVTFIVEKRADAERKLERRAADRAAAEAAQAEETEDDPGDPAPP